MTDPAAHGFDIDPDMDELLAAKRALHPDQSRGGQRSSWNGYAAAMQRPYPPGMDVVDTSLDCVGHDAASRIVRARIYRPRGAPSPSPCVIYIHGGAFIKGSLDSGDPIAWGIADRLGWIVVSLDYSLAPEHPFPAGVEDCYAGVSYVASRASSLGIDPSRIALWGDSAGGNMAAACCLMGRDRGGPSIAAQVVVYACLTDELTSGSYVTYADAPVTTASIDRAWSLYLGDRRPTDEPYASPLKAHDLTNLPPAFIHMAQVDCLADDSSAYAARLEQAGNEVVLRSARRMIHGFMRARFSGERAAAEFEAPCDFLRTTLADAPSIAARNLAS